jgi:CHAT domain-containing protein/Tfp pilus assembly protein PilF
VLGPEHPNAAFSLRYLGHLYMHTGAYAKAEPLYLRALAIQEKVRGPEHPETATSLNNLADLYSQTGAYAKAEPLYQRALTIQEKVLGPKHPDTANSLVNLAALYGKTGQYAKAERLYERALAISERAFGFDHPDMVAWLDGLAELNWAEGEVSRAQTLFERAQRIQEKNSERFLLTGSESRKLAYLQSLSENTHRIVSFSVSVPEPKNVRLGLTSVLQSKGRALDAVADSMARLRQSTRSQDQVLFKQLAELANQLSVLTYRGPDQQSVDNYRKKFKELTGQQERLEADLSKRSSEFRRQIAPVTFASVMAVIPRDAVLIEWFRYVPFDPKQSNAKAQPINARYVAYVLKRNSDPVIVDIGDAQAIEALTREFRKSLVDGGRTNVDVSSAALSEKLVKPLRNYFKGYERILMSPDGPLNLLPFAALLDERGDFLAQHYEVTYLTSARDLLRLSQSSNSHREAFVMADPDFGSSTLSVAQVASNHPTVRSADLDRSGVVFRRLSNTALEAQELKNILKLKGSEVFLQSNATESNLKQVHGPRILHIATHGFFLNDQEFERTMNKTSAANFSADVGENPLLRSGLALAGANARRSGPNDDGVLTSLEAAQLDLHGTELVVLSACDTGVGEVQNGEGVYGLRRALVLAGAQTQLTSLWKVSDEATRILMVDFYQRLLKGEGRSAALRHAQLHMRAIPEYSHPYYWASFIPIGNWTPLPQVQ